MDWVQFALMFITFVGLFIWNRTEARADVRHMDAKLESNRNLSLQIHRENRDLIDANRNVIDAIREDGKNFHQAIREDMKDFHGRMCVIEERRKAKE